MPASLAASLPLGETIKVTLRGEPIGKGRPRGRIIVPKDPRKPAFISFYTPPATQTYEKALALAARVAMGSRAPLQGALQVTVIAYFEVPASWSQTKREKAWAGEIRPSVKPDWDNIAKCCDALNAIVWVDDSQIVDGQAVKLYSRNPRLVIEVVAL